MDKIYEWSESYQGKQRAYLIETEICNGYEIGYYEQKEYSIDYINKCKTPFSLYFAVRSDGRITGTRTSIEEIKEIVNENWK